MKRLFSYNRLPSYVIICSTTRVSPLRDQEIINRLEFQEQLRRNLGTRQSETADATEAKRNGSKLIGLSGLSDAICVQYQILIQVRSNQMVYVFHSHE